MQIRDKYNEIVTQRENEKTISDWLSRDLSRKQLNDLVDMAQDADVRRPLAKHIDELQNQHNFTQKMQSRLADQFKAIPKKERNKNERDSIRKLDQDNIKDNLYSHQKPETNKSDDINDAQKQADKQRDFNQKLQSFYQLMRKNLKKAIDKGREAFANWRQQTSGQVAQQQKQNLENNSNVKQYADQFRNGQMNFKGQDQKQMPNLNKQPAPSRMDRFKNVLRNSEQLHQASTKFSYLAAATAIGLGRLAFDKTKSLVNRIKNHYEQDKAQFETYRQYTLDDLRFKNGLDKHPDNLAKSLNDNPDLAKIPGIFRPIQNHIDEVKNLDLNDKVWQAIKETNEQDNNQDFAKQRGRVAQVLEDRELEQKDHQTREYNQKVDQMNRQVSGQEFEQDHQQAEKMADKLDKGLDDLNQQADQAQAKRQDSVDDFNQFQNWNKQQERDQDRSNSYDRQASYDQEFNDDPQYFDDLDQFAPPEENEQELSAAAFDQGLNDLNRQADSQSEMQR